MRALLIVGMVSVTAVACGGESASSDAASVADASNLDAAPQQDAGFVCGTSPPNSGFVTPDAVSEAFVQQGEGWVSQGPADFSCLGTTSTDAPTSMQVTLSGTLLDFQSGNAVADATVALWRNGDTSGAPAITTTTDVSGDYSVIVPAGALRPAIRVSSDDALDTYTFNTGLPDLASHQLELSSVSTITANALAAFVGVVRTPGLGLAIGRMVDCQGRPVANAIATVSTESAVADGCTTHAQGGVTYYFSAGSSTVPVRHSEQLSTNRDGLFLVIELPAVPMAYVQVWGYTSGQTPGVDTPRLLAELPVTLYADSFSIATVDPLRVP